MVGSNDDINDILNKIDEALKEIDQPVPQPEGSVTVMQYANEKSLSRYCAQDRLIKLYRSGLIERVRWKNTYCYFFK